MELTAISGNIGIIDNDLIKRPRHNFPNLALMKISGYLKSKGNKVELTNFESIDSLFQYDWIVLSKVFTDTETPKGIIERKNVIYGGSGFFYDKAPILPHEIEHFYPDYGLYKNALKLIEKGKESYYKDYSIGFITRGCIRQCSFCINKNYKTVSNHSPVSEFLDDSKPFILLLDDNITASKNFEKIIIELRDLNKPFIFKQGMDFRLLNKNKMELLSTCKKYGAISKSKANRNQYFFAFDNFADKDKIISNLILWNTIFKKSVAKCFYVFVAFDRNGLYDDAFYERDYYELIHRIKILFEHGALAYIMPHENIKTHKYNTQIKILKQYCNYTIRCGNSDLFSFLQTNNINTNIFDEQTLKLNYKY